MDFKIGKEEIKDNTIGMEKLDSELQEMLGDVEELSTTDKTIVGAINELFQSANNGKEIIADAIGGEVSNTDTFTAMGNKIEDITLELREYITDNGVSVGDSDNLYDMLEVMYNSDMFSNDSNIIDLTDCKISCGGYHTFLLMNDGSVYSCGYNSSGQLGLGDEDNRTSFTQVTTNIDDVKEIICGYYHTFLLKNDGTVWCCGDNYYGELGLGDTTDRTTFTQVDISDVKEIICGVGHTFLLKNDGTVWCCGNNSSGQLGLGNTTTTKTSFTQVTTNIDDVKEIICGYQHTFLLKNDGTVYSCGWNSYGQLGLGDTTDKTSFTQVTTNISDVKEIICGYQHTFLLKNDGTVYSCGRNEYGQLGLGTTTNKTTFTQTATGFIGGYLVEDGKEDIVDAVGGTLEDNDTLITMADKIEDINSTLSTFISNNGGTVTGEESLSELLDILYTVTGISFPIELVYEAKQIVCGDIHTLILKNDGSVYSCGYNGYGQLGLGDTTDRTTFTQVDISDVVQIACGDSHTFLLKNDGSVWCCGYNYYGQLGLGNTTNKTSFTQADISDVKEIICGYNHTFLLMNDGSVYSCGYNGYGQLGLGDTTDRTSFTQVDISDVVQIACGDSHTFLLKNDGSVWCCGYNDYGQLGLGNTTNKTSFTQADISDVKEIICGYNHTFLLMNDGSVYSCGYNGYGQLGLGDTTDRTSFTQADISDVVQIACGDSHTFLLKNDGSVWCCGYNYGQLGLGDTTNKTTFTQVTTNIDNDVKQIACGYNHTFLLMNDGSVYSCGYNGYGQLGLGDTTDKTSFTQADISDVKEIICGYNHTFLLKNDGSVYSCGGNSFGQLGLGDTTNRTSFTQVTTNIDNDVVQIACGYIHTFLLKNDGSVWCCGDNDYGQLGLGDTTNKTTFTNTNVNIAE